MLAELNLKKLQPDMKLAQSSSQMDQQGCNMKDELQWIFGLKENYCNEVLGKIEPPSENTFEISDWSVDPQSLVGTSFRCDHCNESFRSSYALGLHNMCVHDSNSDIVSVDSVCLKCDFCDFVGSSQEDLVRHAILHVTNKPNVPDICSGIFQKDSILNKHNKSHNATKLYECPVCDSKYSLKSNLTKHLVRKHRSTIGKALKSYECSVCDAKYLYKKSFNKHVVEKHRSTIGNAFKSYECTLCDCKCSRKNILRQHMVDKHRPTVGDAFIKFECTLCDSRYSRKYTLKQHMVETHRPTVGDAFIRYECTLCDSKYSQKATLKQHMVEIHSPLVGNAFKRYNCTVCDAKYSQKATLRKHILEKHRRKVDVPILVPVYTEVGTP